MGIPKFAAWVTRKYPDIVSRSCPESTLGLYLDMNGIIHPCCHSEEDPAVAQRSDEEKIEQVCLCVDHLVTVTKPRTVLYLAMDGVAPRAKMNQQRARRYMSALDAYGSMLAPEEHGVTTEQRNEVRRELEAAKQALDFGIYGEPHPATDDAQSAQREGGRVSTPTSQSTLDSKRRYSSATLGHGMGSPSKSTESLSQMFPDVEGLVEDFKHAIPLRSAGSKASRHQPASTGEDGAAAKAPFDSNCISPGTVFMELAALRLHEFVQAKLTSGDANWASLTVVLSDTSTPGEGEHKLIDFLRTQTSYGSFEPRSAFGLQNAAVAPNGKDGGTVHIVCGLDADLILLCASLHLHNVVIMRDVRRRSPAFPPHRRRCGTNAVDGPHDDDEATAGGDDDRCDAPEGDTEPRPQASGAAKVSNQPPRTTAEPPQAIRKEYEYFLISRFGDCIVSEVQSLLTLTGFVPKSFDAFDRVVANNGYVYGPQHGPTAAAAALAATEMSSKTRRTARVEGGASNLMKTRRAQRPVDDYQGTRSRNWSPCTAAYNHKVVDDVVAMATLLGNDFLPRLPSAFCGESALDNLLESYVHDVLPYGFLTEGRGEINLAQLHRLLESYARTEVVLFRQHLIKVGACTADEACGLPGQAPIDHWWRTKYYTTTTCTLAKLDEQCRSYIEGLRFVWQYYSCTSEHCSWSWFYPLHHAPFAMDLADSLNRCRCDKRELPAPRTEVDPPPPFAQLMCILPPTSCALLPPALHDVMWNPTTAALRDSFPSEWAVDYSGSSGKDHLATVMLPFADMRALIEIVDAAAHHFTAEERRRNRHRREHVVLRLRTDPGGAFSSPPPPPPSTLSVCASPATLTSPWLMGMASPTATATTAGGVAPCSMGAHCLETWSLADTAPSAQFRPRTYSATVAIRGLGFGAGSANGSVDQDGESTVVELSARGGPPEKSSRSLAHVRNRRGGEARRSGEPQEPSRRQQPTVQSKARSKGQQRNSHEGIYSSSGWTLGDMALVFFAFAAVVLLILVAERSRHAASLYQLALDLMHDEAHVALMAGSVFAVLLALGIASARASVGCNMRRNATRDTYVDWLCGDCLSLNFMRNDRCFQCRAPANEVVQHAIFTGKIPQLPPPFDADHSSQLAWGEISSSVYELHRATHVNSVAASAQTPEVLDNCDML